MPHYYDRILFTNSSVSIGMFDCPVGRPNFNNTGPIKNYLIAFPRTAVKIQHSHLKSPFIADPTLVTLYNDGQEYKRFQLSEYGDRCDWLAVSPEVARAIFEEHHLNKTLTTDELTPLFSMTHCSCTSNTYALFKYLIMKLLLFKTISPLFVEETALLIFNNIVHTAYSEWGAKPKSNRPKTFQRHLKIVQQAQEILNASFDQSISLNYLANELNCSIYHLCRTYQRITGLSIHQTINQLRLREALHNISENNEDLSTLGINLGFSDHSHFSLAFRKAYGFSPTQFKQQIVTHQPINPHRI